ncbi:MAG: hypothetical protein P4L84_03805 [Isosphaeraceae bacterium]|nr:hypothetical protein [Isosphaeraceae bacterium]
METLDRIAVFSGPAAAGLMLHNLSARTAAQIRAIDGRRVGPPPPRGTR